MTDSQNELRAQLAQRNQQLQEIAAHLKTELFGIDPIEGGTVEINGKLSIERAPAGGTAVRVEVPA